AHDRGVPRPAGRIVPQPDRPPARRGGAAAGVPRRRAARGPIVPGLNRARPMRVVSLLPSLTELVCALGHRDELVRVTHEYDFPPGVERLPHLTRSRIEAVASSQAIDALVAEQGGSLYALDGGLLAELRPDLILTQAQCDVCAVNEATVRRLAADLAGAP